MISAAIINQLLQQADIEGFIEAGAPEDEYFSEADMIASAIQNLDDNQIDEQNLASLISLIWIKNFNLEEDEILARASAIKGVAKRILVHLLANTSTKT